MGFLDTIKTTIMRSFPGYGLSASGINNVTTTAFFDFLNNARGGINWEQAAGPYHLHSIDTICQTYIANQSLQLTPMMRKRTAQGEWQDDPEHEILDLLLNPNPYWDTNQLWGATFVSAAQGNGYWILPQNAGGNPVEIWWAPHSFVWYGITPWIGKSGLPEAYRYIVNGQVYMLPLDQVIQMRSPIPAPGNPFVGLDPRMAQWRFYGLDNQLSEASYAITKNLGIPGVLFTPKVVDGKLYTANKAAKDDFIEQYASRTTGTKRGSPTFLDNPYDAVFPNVSPNKMAFGELWNKPEERIPACYGLNAPALSLGAGLQHSTFNNITEAEAKAWEHGIVPLTEIISAGINKLLKRLGTDTAREQFYFNFDMVPALQEDEDKVWDRYLNAFKGDGIDRATFKQKVGLKPEPADVGAYWSMVRTTLTEPAPNEPEPPGQLHHRARIEILAAPGSEDGIQSVINSITASTPIVTRANGKVKGELPPHTARAFWSTEAGDTAPKGTTLLPRGTMTYHAPTQTFVDSAAKGVDRDTVKAAAEALVSKSNADMMQAANGILNGDITAAEFEKLMNTAISNLHGGQTALASGGLPQMEAPEWRMADKVIKAQSKWLDGFVADIKSGRYGTGADGEALSPEVLSRAGMYASAGRGTYENARVEIAKTELGHDEAMRVMGAVAHCADCEEQAALGWQPIEDVLPIGSCECLSSCWCVCVTRNSATGDESEE